MSTKVVTTFVLMLALSACSSGSDSPSGSKPAATKSPSSSSSPGSTDAPTKRACAKVWKNGATLPKNYDGCDKAGADVETVKCKDGSKLIVFDQTYFAITGDKITKSSVDPLQDTEAYGSAYSTCTGE